jgi:uncharacterized protein
MIDLKQILIYLSANKDRYRSEYHLVRIGVFGSLSRGDQHNKSDVDLIVEFEDGTSDLFTIKQKLKSEIQTKFNIPVDICREKYIKPIFKELIFSEVKYA